MRRALAIAAISVIVWGGVLSLACAGNPASRTEADPQWAGQLIVKNRSNADMDIFVARRSDRLRIGLAPNNQTTTFRISPAQVAGVGAVRFVAVPLAASGARAISSEPTTVSPTDTITMDIPPN